MLALGVAATIAVATAPSIASAHHVPGHGVSEGVRTINSLGGGTGKAMSRIALIGEHNRVTQSLSPARAYTTSLLGEYAPHPWVSVGVQPQLLVIDEDAPEEATKTGLGNTRAFVRLTPHADKLVHRVLTTVLNVSIPTRTVTFTADPGPTWSVTPTVLYTRTHMGPFWQALGLATIEHRPAGTAVDVGVGGQAGYRIAGKLAPSLGMLADVRAATFCARIGRSGEDWCADGRGTEVAREVGSLRAYTMVALTYTFSRWGQVNANVQIPVTPKQDFAYAGSVSVQAMF